MMKIYLITLLTLIYFAAPAQQQLIYQTKNLPKPDTTWVFTPKNYKKIAKLPTIFLLHGYGGNYKQWHNIMDAQKYADDYGFIIVCPDGMFNSWYFNSPTKPNWQFETFFFEELFTDIKQKFKVDESNIFISGLSMGGHGALSLFLKQPNLFKSAGSSSGVVDLRSSTVKYGIADLLGKPTDDSDIWLKYSVIGNLEKLKNSTKQLCLVVISHGEYIANHQVQLTAVRSWGACKHDRSIFRLYLCMFKL